MYLLRGLLICSCGHALIGRAWKTSRGDTQVYEWMSHPPSDRRIKIHAAQIEPLLWGRVARFFAQPSETSTHRRPRTGAGGAPRGPRRARAPRDLQSRCTPMEVCAAGDYLNEWRGIADDARRRTLVTVSYLQAIEYVGDVFTTGDGGVVQVTIESWYVQTREQGFVSAPELQIVPQIYVLRRLSGHLFITENYQLQTN